MSTDATTDLAAPSTENLTLSDHVVLEGDVREGTGTHHHLVRVTALHGQDAEVCFPRSGKTKRIRLRTLAADYRLIQRNITIFRCRLASCPGLPVRPTRELPHPCQPATFGETFASSAFGPGNDALREEPVAGAAS